MAEIKTEQDLFCFKSTQEHRELVYKYCCIFANLVCVRGEVHDKSKLEAPEFSLFSEVTPELAGLTYGSTEYQEYLQKLQPALEHHYLNNRHHPEWSIYNNITVLEEWRPIQNFESYYEVSNWGRVRNIVTKSLLKAHKTPAGYYRLQLQVKGKSVNFLVHRLVAVAFIQNPQNKPEVNHINSIRTDNYFQNLEWVTSSENLKHAYDSGFKEIKYIVYCEELNITTIGTGEMERKLKELGYSKARQSSILSCINGRTSHHLNLHFMGYLIEEFDLPKRSLLKHMNLVDIVEMFLDWFAATKRHNNGNIRTSIEINKDRFNLSEDLAQVFINTIELFDE